LRGLGYIALSLFLSIALWLPVRAQAPADLVHVVVTGDTLTSIAAAYDLPLASLLALNDIDPDAYLQIGQRLELPAEAAPAESPTPPAPADSPELPPAPPAPVVPAAAPMIDPADRQVLLCPRFFDDSNGNGMREGTEAYLPGGSVQLRGGAEASPPQQEFPAPPGAAQCLRDLPRGRLVLALRPPAGYSLTVADEYELDLRAAGRIELDFGAQQGQPPQAAPPPLPSAPLPAPPSTSILMGLSGLFLLAAAAFVLAGGWLLALFLRGR